MDQWDGERSAKPESERILPALGVFIRFGQDVCSVNRLAVDDGTPCRARTHKGYGELSDWAGRGKLPIVRDKA